MAYQLHKLRKLLEQNMNEGRGVAGYRTQLREMFGITQNEIGDPTLDRANRILDPKNVDIKELAYAFLGREFGGSDVRRAFAISEQYGQFSEAEGAVVLPSHFAKISAFSDSVSGLIDALTLEAYQSPEWIGDKLFDVKETRVNGGKMIGVMNDGGLGTSLAEGEPYPTVGLKETYVEMPDNVRNGNVIQVNERVFLYDRTDEIEARCTFAGTSVARNKEINQADVALGLVNPYSRDGNAANTYLGTAGDIPNTYVNSQTNELVDWTDVNNAIQLLEGNTDPGTGFEITVPTEGAQMLVMPQLRMTATQILQPEWLRQSTNSGAELRQGANTLPNLNLVVASRVWFNRLTNASVSAANAAGRWHFGLFKKAFIYRQVVPFQVNSAPLSSEDVRRDIVLVKVAREIGVAGVKEPRWVCKNTKE